MTVVRSIAAGLLLLAVGIWTALALYFTVHPVVGVAFAAGGVAGFVWLGDRRRTARWFIAAFLLAGIWFVAYPASQDRAWRSDLRRLAEAEIDGDAITVRNVRNFDYRTETDYTVRYEDRTYDLRKLDTLDLIVSYWGMEDVAHTMFSFGFGGADYLCLSIEIRREEGEEFSGLRGLFKQYEIIYVLGDERDLIRLRTNHRGEDVFVFPVRAPPEDVRRLFVHVLGEVNELARDAAWYHTIGRNCTTSFVDLVNTIWPGRIPYTRKIRMNGYVPEQAYERGTIPNDRPFAEIRSACRVTDRAQRADKAPDFSRRIRTP